MQVGQPQLLEIGDAARECLPGRRRTDRRSTRPPASGCDWNQSGSASRRGVQGLQRPGPLDPRCAPGSAAALPGGRRNRILRRRAGSRARNRRGKCASRRCMKSAQACGSLLRCLEKCASRRGRSRCSEMRAAAWVGVEDESTGFGSGIGASSGSGVGGGPASPLKGRGRWWRAQPARPARSR